MLNPSLLVLGIIAIVLFFAMLGWRRLERYRSLKSSETIRLEQHLRGGDEWPG